MKYIIIDTTWNTKRQFNNWTQVNEFLRKDGWKTKWLKKSEIEKFNEENVLQIATTTTQSNERSRK